MHGLSAARRLPRGDATTAIGDHPRLRYRICKLPAQFVRGLEFVVAIDDGHCRDESAVNPLLSEIVDVSAAGWQCVRGGGMINSMPNQ